MKIVLDTNILVSAFVFGGIPYEIIRKVVAGDLELVLSKPIIAEMIIVLKSKFMWQDYHLKEQIEFLIAIAKIVEPKSIVKFVKLDPGDNKILECAIEAKAQYIITGDKKHLLPIRKYKSIKIVSPTDFYLLLTNKESKN